MYFFFQIDLNISNLILWLILYATGTIEVSCYFRMLSKLWVAAPIGLAVLVVTDRSQNSFIADLFYNILGANN